MPVSGKLYTAPLQIVERRRGPRFLGKTLMFGFADSLRTEHFEGYMPVQVEIAGLVDYTIIVN